MCEFVLEDFQGMDSSLDPGGLSWQTRSLGTEHACQSDRSSHEDPHPGPCEPFHVVQNPVFISPPKPLAFLSLFPCPPDTDSCHINSPGCVLFFFLEKKKIKKQNKKTRNHK